MKSVLVLIAEGRVQSALETALLVAHRFESHIVALHANVPGTRAGQEPAEGGRPARELFNDLITARGIMTGTGSADAPPGPSAEWRDEKGLRPGTAGMLARVFDLIVIERPPASASTPGAMLESVLFEGGRPLLMAPPTAPASLGERVVIAWNGGGETATAIAHAMPLLRRANEVRVISVGTGLIPGAPPGEALTRNLVWHGIRATAHHIDTKAAAGGVWLEECDAARADLLVKGAYTTSHLRQVIFGGPTRQILTQAELPVLLAH